MMVLLTTTNERLEIPDTVKVTQYKQEPDYEIVRAPFSNILRVANDGLPRPNPIQLSGNVYFNSEPEATAWVFNLKNNMSNVASFYDSGQFNVSVSHFNFSAIPTLIPRVLRLSMNIYPTTTSVNDIGLFPRVIESVGSLKSTTSGVFSVRMPSSIMPGDQLIMIIRNAVTMSAPSGWTQLASFSSGGLTYAYAKTATSSDRNIDFVNVTNGSSLAAALCYKIKKQGAVPQAASASGQDPPSLVPTWGTQNMVVLAVVTTSTTNNSFTAPTDYRNLRTIAHPTSSLTTTYRITAADRLLLASSVNPGAFSAIGATSSMHSLTIAVRR